MKSETRKKVDRIYGQIGKIAIKGKDYSLEYDRLVDQIIEKGNFSYLELCLSTYYKIDPSAYKTISDLKKGSWPAIMRQTDSPLITNLRRLYKQKNVYQVGQQIRSELPYFVTFACTGPYVAEDITIKKTYSSQVSLTRYSLVATASQISVAKKQVAGQQKVMVTAIDPSIYRMEVNRVSWATFSTPLYESLSMTQSSSKLGDMMIARLKEKDDQGSFKEGGIIYTAAIRIRDIRDQRTKSEFIGKIVGDRFEFNPFKIYNSIEEVEDMLGLQRGQGASVSKKFEALVLEVRSVAVVEVESPFEAMRVSSLVPEGPAFSVGSESDTGIPVTHGGSYLLSAYRRTGTAGSGWSDSEKKSEVLHYRIQAQRNDLLGTIKEVEAFDNDPSMFYMDRQLASFYGVRKTFLEVSKAGSTASITVIYDNPVQSEEANLFARYKIAIDYLNS